MPVTLAVALAAARDATDPEPRLVALLEAWRVHRIPDLATRIEKLGVEIANARPRLPGKTIDDRNRAWLALAKQHDPRDVDLLLTDPVVLAEHRIGSAYGRVFEEKLAALAAFPPDPRIARALVATLREIAGFSHLEARVLRGIVKMGDPRSVVGVRGLVTRRKLAGKVAGAKALAILARTKAPTATAATTKLLAGIRAIGKAKRKSLTALLAAVYAEPADDGPRLVYADALQEAGNPRGEYIVLACKHERGELDAPGRRRMRELLSANRAKWLAPLDRALAAAGPQEFRRGFLARCRVTGVAMVGEAKIRALYHHPAWALVDEVLLSKDGVRFRAPLVAHLRRLGVTVTVT